jgi:hypothetical protein
MHDNIAHAVRQALEARQRAQACIDTNTRDEWLRVAAMWDGLVDGYKELEMARDRMTTEVWRDRPGA